MTAKMKHILILSFCLIQLSNVSASIRVLKKSIDVSNKVVFHTEYTEGNPSLSYALCDKTTTNYERNCTVVLEKSPLSNDTYSCDVTLKFYDREESSDLRIIHGHLVPFGKDNIVLHLQQYNNSNFYHKLVTIRLSSCKVNETIVTSRFNIRHLEIVPFEDYYEVHYSGFSFYTKNTDYLRLVVDVDGKVIDGPANVSISDYAPDYLNPFPATIPIDTQSRDKGVFYVGYHRENEIDVPCFIVIRPDGSKKYLDTSKLQDPDAYTLLLRPRASIAHNLIGVCTEKILDDVLAKNPMKCLQFDVNGELKFQTDSVADNKAIGLIYNLPNGGLLVAAVDQFRSYPDGETRTKWFIVKIDSNGKVFGKVNINDSEFNSNYTPVRFFYNDREKHYCVSFLVKKLFWSKETKKFSLITDCFTDEDFVNHLEIEHE